jgi:predicted aldo/keto reductase-like oxidoreductase
MEKTRLGRSPLIVSRIALGCMRLSDDAAQAMTTVRAALDQGIDFFDHADIYGRGRKSSLGSGRALPSCVGRSSCSPSVASGPLAIRDPMRRRATTSPTSTLCVPWKGVCAA